MGDAQDSFLQVALDGAGQKVKIYKLVGLRMADGTTADVVVQAFAVTGVDGRAVDFDEMISAQQAILRELRAIRSALGALTEDAELALGSEDEDDS